MGQILTGAEILLESLIAEGVDTIFGYPGGQILSVYDKLYSYTDRLNHILVRHEQGAVHAAQGYARASSRPGVVMVTSGPGATNVITGIADAMIDSTPIVVIAGQVGTAQLGTDAFQETDLVGMTAPISKWVYQIKEASEVAEAVAKAFHIATTGRPGPVVLDFTKTAQVGSAEYKFSKCDFIRSYVPVPTPDSAAIDEAVRLIDEAERPLVIFGQGIILSHAEEQLKAFLKKGGIPATSTLLGLSALPSDFPYYIGMAGMHGNVAPNMMTQRCDLLIAVGMRFDDRVTGRIADYASQARKIHIDIDPSEINKVIHVDVGINGDARQVLAAITERMRFSFHDDWTFSARNYERVEDEKVVAPEVRPESGSINMGEVVAKVAEASLSGAIVVTDVGQNQMTAARYSRFVNSRSFISSGGLGTMGFGLPAAIGAKIGAPGRNVVLFVGDGGLQMTVQEFGTIMQEHVAVKIVMLNNNWLGNVRQWQELFFGERYSQTRMLNPEYCLIARAYGIRYRMVEDREFLDEAVREMLDSKEPYLLDVHVNGNEMVYPMIPPGKRVDEIMLNKDEWYHDAE
ncbi:MAG: biosynthetic-type acetolactate synthase large subunit [Bacteroidales bacterium]|jgi:acetolactate synthase-1/2/3 large subunit|nr:biosynthetic-type acetolactate synthase large subunit [Bacteroidales bacterium]